MFFLVYHIKHKRQNEEELQNLLEYREKKKVILLVKNKMIKI